MTVEPIVAQLILLALVIPLIVRTHSDYIARADRLVHEWATKNTLSIISLVRAKGLWAGPFRFRFAGQEIYKFTAQDAKTAAIKTGWLRLGSFSPSWNVPTAEFEIVWEDETLSTNRVTSKKH